MIDDKNGNRLCFIFHCTIYPTIDDKKVNLFHSMRPEVIYCVLFD